MDPVISDLIDRYEKGRLSRRELVSGLSALAAAGAAGPALAEAAPPAVLKPTGIEHVSILVADLERSKAFYERVFGLVPVSVDEAYKIVRLAYREPGPDGRRRVIVSLRQEAPAGITDHWCLKLEGFNADAVTERLKGHGLTTQRNVEFGFYVRDPDGIVVQMN